jgi:ABC-2 type transport system ATP-binding protein
MSTPVSCRGVSRWYGQVIGVSDITTEAGPGITGLLGPNGAGKSTLMKLITGQLKPSQGECLLFGERVFANPRALRHLGFSPEHDALYEELSAHEFVSGLLRLSGFSAAESTKRAKEALARVDLADEKRPLGQFSKGMRQRAKLAQAIAHDPAVLVLDEPLNGLDPTHRRKVIDLVREMGAAGKAVIVSSHVLHEVEAMTSEIRLIAKGRLLASGAVSDIRALIDKHPHRISVRCEKPRELGARLLVRDFVGAVGLEGKEGLWVETFRPDACYDAIRKRRRRSARWCAASRRPTTRWRRCSSTLSAEARRAARVLFWACAIAGACAKRFHPLRFWREKRRPL